MKNYTNNCNNLHKEKYNPNKQQMNYSTQSLDQKISNW